jgi:hypothetical protein
MSKHGLLKGRDGIPARVTKLNNVVLAPANLLAWKTQWPNVANNHPEGHVLIVLPRHSRQAARVDMNLVDDWRASHETDIAELAERIRNAGQSPWRESDVEEDQERQYVLLAAKDDISYRRSDIPWPAYSDP